MIKCKILIIYTGYINPVWFQKFIYNFLFIKHKNIFSYFLKICISNMNKFKKSIQLFLENCLPYPNIVKMLIISLTSLILIFILQSLILYFIYAYKIISKSQGDSKFLRDEDLTSCFSKPLKHLTK